jgi:hypothetical protein
MTAPAAVPLLPYSSTTKSLIGELKNWTTNLREGGDPLGIVVCICHPKDHEDCPQSFNDVSLPWLKKTYSSVVRESSHIIRTVQRAGCKIYPSNFAAIVKYQDTEIDDSGKENSQGKPERPSDHIHESFLGQNDQFGRRPQSISAIPTSQKSSQTTWRKSYQHPFQEELLDVIHEDETEEDIDEYVPRKKCDCYRPVEPDVAHSSILGDHVNKTCGADGCEAGHDE